MGVRPPAVAARIRPGGFLKKQFSHSPGTKTEIPPPTAGAKWQKGIRGFDYLLPHKFSSQVIKHFKLPGGAA